MTDWKDSKVFDACDYEPDTLIDIYQYHVGPKTIQAQEAEQLKPFLFRVHGEDEERASVQDSKIINEGFKSWDDVAFNVFVTKEGHVDFEIEDGTVIIAVRMHLIRAEGLALDLMEAAAEARKMRGY